MDNSHLLTIKQVSQLTGVPAYTLRFWEREFSEFLKPSRTNGGQRRYSQKHVKLIEKIRRLVHQRGMSLAAAKEKLRTERELEETRKIINKRLSNGEEFALVIDEVAEIIKQRVVDLYFKKKMEY